LLSDIEIVYPITVKKLCRTAESTVWYGGENEYLPYLAVMSEVNGPFIVYVDDDTDDLFLVKETLKTIDSSIAVHDYTNGKEALAFLESIPAGHALPSLVILDLNMPEWTGLQILDAMKQNSIFQEIPVFIFTNSDHPQHKEASFAKGAIDFITKPYRNVELIHICSKFANYIGGASWDSTSVYCH
jgi:CheY-like chemotaxis protein